MLFPYLVSLVVHHHNLRKLFHQFFYAANVIVVWWVRNMASGCQLLAEMAFNMALRPRDRQSDSDLLHHSKPDVIVIKGGNTVKIHRLPLSVNGRL